MSPSAPARRGGLLLAATLAAGAAPVACVLYGVLSLAAGLLTVAAAWLTKSVLDNLGSDAGMSALLVPALGLTLVGVVAALLPHVCRYLSAEVDRRTALRADARLFTKAAAFPGLSRFEDPDFLDRLQLARQGGGRVPAQVMNAALGLVRSAITITGFLGSLLVLNPVLTLLVAAAGVPTLCAEIALARGRAGVAWRVGATERREWFYAGLLADAEAAKEVRLFAIGGFLRDRMLAERRTADAARRAVDRREVAVQSGLGLLAALMTGGSLLWAVRETYRGELSAGDVTLLVAAIAGTQSAFAALAHEAARAGESLMIFGHYRYVIEAPPDLVLAPDPRPLPALRRGIELRDVWFRYSDRHPWVLRGVNLTIPHGSSTALVGLNGSGKTTLVKLLCRFYDPTRGAILWDGVDLREVDPAALRDRITAVFQDFVQYDLTAAENIALGDLGALDDEEQIVSAARRAGAHDTLEELPKGYRTPLTRTFFMEGDKDDPESGVLLSGGQSQRLALARAFLRGTRDLMILDEPSARLDAEAEYEIHAAIARHRRGRTSLLISHRMGSLRNADVIVVLSGGRIVERGDHARLLADGGEYARLFALQATGYLPDAAGPSEGAALTEMSP
ncbi:ABC transporter ATP-binding protein [Streptomyces griseicoloratus]|uniref:ABC transporter ATP-binding protein n=1 Tax=Streptomyces griseicoloratus TaxID=2752516 RepID=UPI001CB6C3A7|nr:ABC transporter ATP-binding protein [Streptomyces griseicoloratus]